jgi:hypothetical protein
MAKAKYEYVINPGVGTSWVIKWRASDKDAWTVWGRYSDEKSAREEYRRLTGSKDAPRRK